jgi:tetratricopeptide (TPR) repeat protein
MKGLAFLNLLLRRSRRVILPGLLIAVFAAPLAIYGFGHFHYRAAQRALAERDFPTARNHLARCLNVWFCSARAHLLAARTARRTGAYDEAEQCLRACRALGAPAESVDLESMLLRAQRGDLAHAESYLVSRVMENHPDTILILEVLTKAYAQAYRLVDAEECVRRWLEREPEDVLAWTWHGQLAQDAFNNGEAMRAYARIVELDPDNDDARLVLASLLIRKSAPEALKHFQCLRRRLGDVPLVLVGLASCERNLAHPDEARRLLDMVLPVHPQNWSALAERARLALEYESPQEAEKWFRQAIGIIPFEKDMNYGLYQCLVRLGKNKEAETQLAKLKRCEADLDRLRAAIRAAGQKADDPSLPCEVGQILMRNGQEAAGVRWLQRALATDPGYVPAHRALADYYERTGNSVQAAGHRRPALARPDQAP